MNNISHIWTFVDYSFIVNADWESQLNKNFQKGITAGYCFLFFIFSEWCAERIVSPALEEMSVQQLDQNLTKFYAEARCQDGQSYSKSASILFRYSIEWHLNTHPNKKGISIKGEAFKQSTKMLVSVLRKLRREGQDNVTHKEMITEGDMKLLKTSGVFSKNNPLGLLLVVWFYVMTHWYGRGGEGLRDLRPDSFTFKKMILVVNTSL